MVDATDRDRLYDITVSSAGLYPGTNAVNGNLCDGQGNLDRRSFVVDQYGQYSIKFFTGGTTHSDKEPPYRSIEQSDFGGGRGNDDLDKDATRFYDSYRAETWKDKVILGPEEQYAHGIRLGDDVVTNGGFDADSDWTKGTGWTIAAGVANCDGSQVAPSSVYQNAGLVIGQKYRITFTISNYVAGTIAPACGTGAIGTYRSANGTYTEILTCAGSSYIFIGGDADFEADIDDVIVKAHDAMDEHWWDDNEATSDQIARPLMSILWSDYQYYSYKFTASTTYTPAYIFCALGHNYKSSGTSFTAHVYSDSGGEPDASLMDTGTQTPIVYERIHRFAFASPVELTAGTVYHVVYYSTHTVNPALDTTGYYALASATSTASTAYKSDNGSDWSAATEGIFFRLVPDETNFTPFFFTHKECQYVALSYDDGTNPKVFRNGYRGTATSATDTTLVDTGQAWTVDALIGAIVILHNGTGADAERRWQAITDNDATSITVASWDINPDETTQYTIVNTNIWNEVMDHGMIGRITDVLEHNNIVYFCRGDNNDIYHMYDDTWTAEDGNRGTFIAVAPDSNGRMKVWLANRGFPSVIFSATPTFAEGELTPSDLSFGSDSMTSVSVTDWDMETSGVGDWSQVATAALAKFTYAPYEGAQAMSCNCDADGDGFKQAVTTVANGIYRISYFYRITSAQTDQHFFEFDGTELFRTTTHTDGEYVNCTVYGTASGASTDMEWLGDGGDITFQIDNVMIDRVSNLYNFGSERITNLLAYGPDRRCHAITSGGIYREDNGEFYDISPEEMGNVPDDRNGKAALMHDVYLYISFLDGVERFYEGSLDDIGPNRDEGLPANRRGNIVDMVGYAGRIYAAVNGGDSNYSSILLYNGLGWHEVYRAPATGMEIRKLWIQPIPGQYIDRLWFSEGDELLWIGIDLNPITNSNYRYCPCGEIQMSSIYAGMPGVEKVFVSMKVIGDNFATDSEYVRVQLRQDSGYYYQNAGLIGVFDTSPSETINASYYGYVTYTAIVFKPVLLLKTSYSAETPQMNAVVVDLIEHQPVKWSYTWTMFLSDEKETRQGASAHTRIETDWNLLKTHCNSADPVILNSPFSYADDIYVKLVSVKPRSVLADDRTQIESAVVTCMAVDV